MDPSEIFENSTQLNWVWELMENATTLTPPSTGLKPTLCDMILIKIMY